MPFVPVPKDLAKVKTKVAFNLTKRQIVCFGGGGLVGVPAYLLTRGAVGGMMLPFFLFGIYEKDGQPLEAILRHMIRAKFLCAGTRPYQTDNLYAALSRQTKEVLTIENKTAGKAGKKPASGKKGTEKRKV